MFLFGYSGDIPNHEGVRRACDWKCFCLVNDTLGFSFCMLHFS